MAKDYIPKKGDRIQFTYHLTADCYFGATGTVTQVEVEQRYCNANMDEYHQDHSRNEQCGGTHHIPKDDDWMMNFNEISLLKPITTSHEVW